MCLCVRVPFSICHGPWQIENASGFKAPTPHRQGGLCILCTQPQGVLGSQTDSGDSGGGGGLGTVVGNLENQILQTGKMWDFHNAHLGRMLATFVALGVAASGRNTRLLIGEVPGVNPPLCRPECSF